jgi:hypothetical protein
MSGPLDKFIMENREQFDADAPDPRVWEKINERMNPEEDKKAIVARVRSISFKRSMLAAAAVLSFLGLATVLYYSLYQNKPSDQVASTSPKQSNNLPKPTTDTAAQIAKVKTDKLPSVATQKTPESGTEKEMYYYAKLIEIKHEELKTLEKDEPLLYRQFSGDVQKLDSVYHSLKVQLPGNSNREQLIEAMISNLQLQIGLLNKQLSIIKKIKHSKKSAYENAYKSA